MIKIVQKEHCSWSTSNDETEITFDIGDEMAGFFWIWSRTTATQTLKTRQKARKSHASRPKTSETNHFVTV